MGSVGQGWQAWLRARWASLASGQIRRRSTALARAIAGENVPTALSLLNQGADPNTTLDGRPLLLVALDTFHQVHDWTEGHDRARGLTVLRTLLAAGADPNGRTPLPRPLDVAPGATIELVRSGLFVYDHPLHQAVSDGLETAVRTLMAQGADPLAQERLRGETCLGSALHQAPGARMAQVLIDAGSPVDQVNSWGQTCLAWAHRGPSPDPVLIAVLERAELRTTLQTVNDAAPGANGPALPRRRL